ncbi:MAG: hypothetical protein FWG87_04515 [Defluviitaleaceae bacterium]|nr:hypothetical protein [Defluviitaleaceae bacterium]
MSVQKLPCSALMGVVRPELTSVRRSGRINPSPTTNKKAVARQKFLAKCLEIPTMLQLVSYIP